MDNFQTELLTQLTRIANALERHTEMMPASPHSALGREIGTYLANTSAVTR